MTEAPRVLIDAQIAEVERELALREQVYPTFVARARITQHDADEQMARMKAALRTLKWCKENAEAIKRVMQETK